MKLAHAIRNLRGPGRTQEQFAQEVRVTRERISEWEHGENISLENLRRLVALGLDPAYLLGDTQALPSSPHAGGKNDGEAA